MGTSYVHPDVAAVRRLHRDLRARGAGGGTRRRWIEKQTETLLAAHAAGDPASTIQLRATAGIFSGRSADEILAQALTEDEAFTAIALDHGFSDPDDVDETALDLEFEAALDQIERADLETFRTLVARQPELARARSGFGHRATLLHYLAANGIEIARQGVPLDAPRFAMVLVEAGADPSATMRAYGGEWTVRALLESSAHPTVAGVEAEFAHVLGVADA